MLSEVFERAQGGDIVTAKQMFPVISAAVGRDVSLAYIYKLLHRHRWRRVGPPPACQVERGRARIFQVNLSSPLEAIAAQLGSSRPLRLLFHDEARFGRLHDAGGC